MPEVILCRNLKADVIGDMDKTFSELAVYCIIAAHADTNGGRSWPLIPTIAKLTHLSERSVRKVITRLESKGLISCFGRAGGRGKRTHYSVTIKEEPQASSFNEERGNSELPPLEPVKGELQDHKGGTTATERGNKLVPPESPLKTESPETPSDSPKPTAPRPDDEKASKDDFVKAIDALWKLAPKTARTRSSKLKVAKAIKNASPKLTTLGHLRRVCFALKAWTECDDWTKDDGQYVPGLHRWINDRKFDDMPDGTETPEHPYAPTAKPPATATPQQTAQPKRERIIPPPPTPPNPPGPEPEDHDSDDHLLWRAKSKTYPSELKAYHEELRRWNLDFGPDKYPRLAQSG